MFLGFLSHSVVRSAFWVYIAFNFSVLSAYGDIKEPDRIRVAVQMSVVQNFAFSNIHRDKDGSMWEMYRADYSPSYGRIIELSYKVLDNSNSDKLPIAFSAPEITSFYNKKNIFLKLPQKKIGVSDPIIVAREADGGFLNIVRGEIVKNHQFDMEFSERFMPSKEELLKSGDMNHSDAAASMKIGSTKFNFQQGTDEFDAEFYNRVGANFELVNLYSVTEMTSDKDFYLPMDVSRMISGDDYDKLYILSLQKERFKQWLVEAKPGARYDDWQQVTPMLSDFVNVTYKCVVLTPSPKQLEKLASLDEQSRQKNISCKQYFQIHIEYERREE